MKNAILMKGHGYWLTTNYPIGGCFRRASKDQLVTITGEPIFIKSQGWLTPFTFENEKGYSQSFCFKFEEVTE